MKKPNAKDKIEAREKLYHRITVALNPSPANTSVWQDRYQASNSQRAVAILIYRALQTLSITYNSSSTSTLVKQLPPIYNSITSILTAMQSYFIPPPPIHTNSGKNLAANTLHTQAIWRSYNPTPLLPTFPKSRAHLIPSKAEAEESKNLHNMIVVLRHINTAADLCLDFDGRGYKDLALDLGFFHELKSVHDSLSQLLATIRPTWHPPKFTAALLTTKQLHTPIPKKHAKPEQHTDEWRRLQREQYHRQKDKNKEIWVGVDVAGNNIVSGHWECRA